MSAFFPRAVKHFARSLSLRPSLFVGPGVVSAMAEPRPAGHSGCTAEGVGAVRAPVVIRSQVRYFGQNTLVDVLLQAGLVAHHDFRQSLPDRRVFSRPCFQGCSETCLPGFRRAASHSGLVCCRRPLGVPLEGGTTFNRTAMPMFLIDVAYFGQRLQRPPFIPSRRIQNKI